MAENKYKNKKVVRHGLKFDSEDEADYNDLLVDLQRQGVVKSFERQVKFVLQPSFMCGGRRYMAITYTVDFVVTYSTGAVVAIDVKGMSTQQGEMRRKMFVYHNQGLPLVWVAKSKKYGDKYGWIDYDELQKKRREAKKQKAAKGSAGK